MKLETKRVPVNGKEIVVKLVEMGETEGMFLTDVATMLSINAGTVRDLMLRHNLRADKIGGQNLDTPKDLGLVSKMVRSINLLPRDTIRALVKIVNTEEAWAAYNYLWDVAEKPETAANHYYEASKGPELRDAIQQLMGDQVLNSLQMAEVLGAIDRRLVDLGIKIDRLMFGKVPAKALILGDIKAAWFGASKKDFTYKNLPQKELPTIFEFIKRWQPSEYQNKKLRDCKMYKEVAQ